MRNFAEQDQFGGKIHDENRLRCRARDRDGDPVPGTFLNAIILLACILTYLLNEAVLKDSGSAFFRSHFNDVLAAPILLAFSNLLAADGTASRRFVSSVPGSLLIVGAATITWEVLTPHVLRRSVADPFDALSYATGAVGYLLVSRTARPSNGGSCQRNFSERLGSFRRAKASKDR